MEEIRRNQLIELFKALPKESFELLLRNITIREKLEDLWKEHAAGKKLGYGERFEALFEEVFRFFFRPLEITLRGFRQLRFLMPIPEIVESIEGQWELINTWKEFLDSLFSHLTLMTELSLGITTPPVVKSFLDSFRESWRQRLDLYYKHYLFVDIEEIRLYADYPFILTKKTSQYLMDALDEWEQFTEYYMEFKDMIRSTYREAIKEFVDLANKQRFNTFKEFRNRFIELSNQKFDTLLRSKRYLEVQGKMVSHLMDYLYRTRRFFEEMFENNPLNPFATVGNADEAHKRIMELRRKVKELERRIEELESKKEIKETKAKKSGGEKK